MKLLSSILTIRFTNSFSINSFSPDLFIIVKFFLVPILIYYTYLRGRLQGLLKHDMFHCWRNSSYVLNRSLFVHSSAKERLVVQQGVLVVKFRFLILSTDVVKSFVQLLFRFDMVKQLVENHQIKIGFNCKVL